MENVGKLPIALVRPFKEVLPVRKKDMDLKLRCLQASRPSECILILLTSVIRGAFLVPELDRKEHFVVVDINDTDMFLRMREMYPEPQS